MAGMTKQIWGIILVSSYSDTKTVFLWLDLMKLFLCLNNLLL